MPKFNIGDVVTPVKTELPYLTETHIRHHYTEEMVLLMQKGCPLHVDWCDSETVYAEGYSWHVDDLELYHLDVENK